MPLPELSFTAVASRIVHAGWFQKIIVAAILAAGLLAGLETNASLLAAHDDLFKTLDRVVLGIFIVELALKIVSHGRTPWNYFRDGWNVFDFIIVVVCSLPLHTQFAAVLRLARGLRLLRLVTALPKLQLLVGALLKSLGAMGYVSLLLGLMFYIYAVAGVHLFGAHDPDHFGTLGAALLVLFQVITLDNWSDIFAAIREASPVLAIAYLVSFIMLGTMIMLNLFIGIIMNSMSEMHDEIEERDRMKKLRETGHPSMESEMRIIERDMKRLLFRLSTMRRRHGTSMSPNLHEIELEEVAA
jgi:voltage-gated sodium channel